MGAADRPPDRAARLLGHGNTDQVPDQRPAVLDRTPERLVAIHPRGRIPETPRLDRQRQPPIDQPGVAPHAAQMVQHHGGLILRTEQREIVQEPVRPRQPIESRRDLGCVVGVDGQRTRLGHHGRVNNPLQPRRDIQPHVPVLTAHPPLLGQPLVEPGVPRLGRARVGVGRAAQTGPDQHPQRRQQEHESDDQAVPCLLLHANPPGS